MTADLIAQVEHAVALQHYVGIFQHVLRVHRPEVALAGPEDDGCDVHAHFVDQARGKHLATDVASSNLDQPVTAYLSGFKVPGGITLRQLLSHTSGLAESVLEPIAAPGQVFSYSPVGYSVVAQVIQQVSGRPFADQLIGDLGLPSTTLAMPLASSMPPSARRQRLRTRIRSSSCRYMA